MHLLSQIIVKEWFKSLFASLIVLFLLVSIGDIINGFLQNYPFNRILIEYALKLPELTGKMLPMSTLLASLFSIHKLKTHSELMAILSSGYSTKKIYKLIFLCSLAVGAIQFINLGFIVPLANQTKRNEFEKSRKNESKYLARSKIGASGLIWYKTDRYFTSFAAFDSQKNILKDVTIYFLSKNHKLDSIYKAKSARYAEKNKWLLSDISVIQLLEGTEFPKQTTALNLSIELDESPEDFNQFKSDITTLDIFTLSSFIDRLTATDINTTEYKIMYFEKISLAIICIVFSLFPISGIFSPSRRSAGFGKNVVMALVFTIFFWGVHSGGISLANSEKLPAIVAIFSIPALFSLYMAAVFMRNRNL